jgi:hypothetical protein
MILAVALAAILAARAPGIAQTGMPPAHPPVGGGGAGVQAPPPGSGAGAQGLRWTPPAGWKEVPPASPMRRAQYRIAGPGGDAECVVFYFGPGQGGDAASNVTRWTGQFTGAAVKQREIKVGDMPVVVLEVTGTYVGGMGGGPAGPPRLDYMLLGAIARGPDANWFFRATGPRATLEAQRAGFERMIRSLRAGG